MYKKEAGSFWGLLFEKSVSKRHERDFSLKEKKINLYFTLFYSVCFHAPCKVVKLVHNEIDKDPTSLAFSFSPLSMAGQLVHRYPSGEAVDCNTAVAKHHFHLAQQTVSPFPGL